MSGQKSKVNIKCYRM